jgi:cyclopropane-fatty-acyl-phospholipid synthase
VPTLVPAWMQRLRHTYVRHQPRSERNTKAGARTNIQRHYDLSNDLFACFLDDTMTYSCARFEHSSTSLADAQRHKIDTLLDAIGVGLGTRLLEIGTGWGELAVRGARRGATVTTLTLSEQQAALARRRAQVAGVAGRVDVQLRDYRDVEGRYDAIVSVEMIEAVGMEYWPTYFATLDRVLAPGGRLGVQAILLAHDRMLATRDQYTWISKYIFPGGALPSLRAIEEIVREHTGLQLDAVDAFGTDYARTLRAWRERFDAHVAEVDALGFDHTFRRMWDFYLAYCEAGFATGYLDVAQIVLSRRALA